MVANYLDQDLWYGFLIINGSVLFNVLFKLFICKRCHR